jgi:hypothetical protein
MKVETGTKAAQFLFWEYINGIFVAVQRIQEVKIVFRLARNISKQKAKITW